MLRGALKHRAVHLNHIYVTENDFIVLNGIEH